MSGALPSVNGGPHGVHDHHFLNRIACLDFANTVVYRNRPDRCEDRLSSASDVKGWAAMAGLNIDENVSLSDALALRAAIDRVFRHLAATGVCPAAAWKRLVSVYARQINGAGLEIG